MITIGFPVYNDKRFVARALESLLAQSFQDFELIISDDCSTDGSALVCEEYAKKDARIRYVRQAHNIGISRNMEFLLKLADRKYFMWAANDDLWHVDFIKNLVLELENNNTVISAFCPMHFIDEEDKMLLIPPPRKIDYSGENSYERLKKLIKIFDDCFGYGIFRRSEILQVRFPTWWWINKNCPYNNIYPTLCFYLAKGNFILCDGEDLWYNRLKNNENINHKVPYNNSFIRGLLAFCLRKFNLVICSLASSYRGHKSCILIFKILPFMLVDWFFRPSLNEFRNRFGKYLRNEINFF